MNKEDALDLMQSDMKLWDTAKKQVKGNKVEVTLDLPLGIGEHTVTLEGMDNAQGKRNAVGAYGEYIRGLIDEQINDEAVTARAKAAAARSEPDDSPDGFGVDPNAGVQHAAGEAEAVQATGETHQGSDEGHADFGTTLIARESALRARVERAEANITSWNKELVGVVAALEAMGYTHD